MHPLHYHLYCRTGGAIRRSTRNQSLSSTMQTQILFSNYSRERTMGLYPGQRSVLSTREQAPLSSGFLLVRNDAEDDELGCESVHRISAYGSLDPG